MLVQKFGKTSLMILKAIFGPLAEFSMKW